MGFVSKAQVTKLNKCLRIFRLIVIFPSYVLQPEIIIQIKKFCVETVDPGSYHIVDDTEDVDHHGDAGEQDNGPVKVGQGHDAGVVLPEQVATDVRPGQVVHELFGQRIKYQSGF